MKLCWIELTSLSSFVLVFVLADATNIVTETFDRATSSKDILPVILSKVGDDGGPEEFYSSASFVQTFRTPPIQPVPSIINSSEFAKEGYSPTSADFHEPSGFRNEYPSGTFSDQQDLHTRELISYTNGENYPSSETRTIKNGYTSHEQAQYYHSSRAPQHDQSFIQSEQSRRLDFDTQHYTPQQIQQYDYDQFNQNQESSHTQSSDKFYQDQQSNYDHSSQQQPYYSYSSNYDPYTTRQRQQFQRSYHNDNSYQSRGPNNEHASEGDHQLDQDQATPSDSSVNQSHEGDKPVQTSAEDQSLIDTNVSDQSSTPSAQEENNSTQVKIKSNRRGLLGRINQRRKAIKKSNSTKGSNRSHDSSPARDDKKVSDKRDNDKEANPSDTPPERETLQPSKEQLPSLQQQTPQSADLKNGDSSLQNTTEDPQVVDQEPTLKPSQQDQETPDQQIEESSLEDSPVRPQRRRNQGARMRKIRGKRRRLRPGAPQKVRNGSRVVVRARSPLRARNGLKGQQLINDSQSQDAQRNSGQDGDQRIEQHTDQDTIELGSTVTSTEISSEKRGSASVIQKSHEQVTVSSKSTRTKNFRQNRPFVRPKVDQNRGEDNADKDQNKSAPLSSSTEAADSKQSANISSGLGLDEAENESETRPQLPHQLRKNHLLQSKPSTPTHQADTHYDNDHIGDDSRGANSNDKDTKIIQLSANSEDKSNDEQFSISDTHINGDLQRHIVAKDFGILQHSQQAIHPLNPTPRGNNLNPEIAAGNQASNRNVAPPKDYQRDIFANDSENAHKSSPTRSTDFSSRPQDTFPRDQRLKNHEATEVKTTSQTLNQNGSHQPNKQQDPFSYAGNRRVSDPTDQATFVNTQLEGYTQDQLGRHDVISDPRIQYTNQNGASPRDHRTQAPVRETTKDMTDLPHQTTFSNTQQRNHLQNQRTIAQTTEATARNQFSYQNPISPLNQRQGSIPKINNESLSRATFGKSSRRQRLRKQRVRSGQTTQDATRNRSLHRNINPGPNRQIQNSFSESKPVHASSPSEHINTDYTEGSHSQPQREKHDYSALVTSRNRPSRPSHQNVAFEVNHRRQISSRNSINTDASSDNYQVKTFQNQLEPRNQASYRNERPQSNQHQQNAFSHRNNERSSSSDHYTTIGNSRGRLRNPSRRKEQNVRITTGRHPYQNVYADPNNYEHSSLNNNESEQIPSPSHITNTYQREQAITSTVSHGSVDQYGNHNYKSSRKHIQPDSSHSLAAVSSDFQSHLDAKSRDVKPEKPTNAHGLPAFTTDLQPESLSPTNSFQSSFDTQTYYDRSTQRRTSSQQLRGSNAQSPIRKKSREETLEADSISPLQRNTNRKSTSISRHNQGFPPARETSHFAFITENTSPSDPHSGVDEEYFAEIVDSPIFSQASHDYLEWKIAAFKRPKTNEFPGLTDIPYTGFTCSGKNPGYYADTDDRAKCQSFHFCAQDGRRISYLCPEGTAFNQRLNVCDHVFRVRCTSSQTYHHMNERLYGHNYQIELGDFTTAFRDFGKKLSP
ncbi:uncharacterized protein LOC143035354 [Oratosquilla oratoria]|uniref:uncharacterized protein LOC143035354 n=1 Tax=Oratosquilla oratoria TaxID=337810 RepID=UPI003F757B58